MAKKLSNADEERRYVFACFKPDFSYAAAKKLIEETPGAKILVTQDPSSVFVVSATGKTARQFEKANKKDDWMVNPETTMPLGGNGSALEPQ